MNIVSLSIASLKSRPVQTGLCLLAIACGISIITAVFLLFSSIDSGLMKNARGVDIVVGAKGSPLQLILSTIYHADIPTGNIDEKNIETLQKNPQVRNVIPIAIGDNHKGWRVVGTTKDYIDLYQGELSDGQMFNAPYEAVAGASTNLETGEKFTAHHGLGDNDVHEHDEHPYVITGKLSPTGTVLDRLIITSYQSVQNLHSHHDHGDSEREITALLVKAKTPAALMNLPRQINKSADVIAASPSHTMARVMKNMGLGRDTLIMVGGVFLFLSMLILLSTLASALTERRHDLAVLRVLGASPVTIAGTVLTEAVIVSTAGAILGVITGHLLACIAVYIFAPLQSLILPSAMLAVSTSDIILVAAGALCGMIASMVPCAMAMRTDIAEILSQGK